MNAQGEPPFTFRTAKTAWVAVSAPRTGMVVGAPVVVKERASCSRSR